MFRYGALACLSCGLLFLGGCGENASLHETWKSTKGMYYTYVNPPASIDYDDAGDLSTSEANLAANMRPVDAELTRFERYMMNQDKPPSPERVEQLFGRFRWVNGVVALSPEGEVLAQEPPTALKTLDYQLIVAAEKAKERDPRAAVQFTELGPELILGVPIFNGGELQGYYAANFDIRVLLAAAPDPESMSIVTPEGVLWAGSQSGGASAAEADWGKLTRNKVGGSISSGGGRYYWLCRYFAGEPLVFIAPETSEKPRLASHTDAQQEDAATPQHGEVATYTQDAVVPYSPDARPE